MCLDGSLPKEIHCVIAVTEPWASVRGVQAGLETLCNLLARFCNHVTVVIPRVQSKVVAGEILVDRMRAVDPYGTICVVEAAPEADLYIHLGGEGGPQGRTIYWAYQGWGAYVSGFPAEGIVPTGEFADHSVGAEMAACLAGAAAFNFWVARSLNSIRPFYLDSYALREASSFAGCAQPTEPISIRPLDVLMVGGGSVGSATAYFLPRLGFKGRIDVVDADVVKVENMDRSPIFDPIHDKLPKANVVRDYLVNNGIGASGYHMTWNEFVSRHRDLLRRHSVWLPLANEQGVRRAMQANIPPISIQASTGKNWNVQYGRHIPFVDDCQIDRFPATESAPTVCATGPVVVTDGHVADAALPFASFTAGLFVAIGLKKVAMGIQEFGENAAFLSFKPSFSLLTQPRRPNPTCMCQNLTSAIWKSVWRP